MTSAPPQMGMTSAPPQMGMTNVTLAVPALLVSAVSPLTLSLWLPVFPCSHSLVFSFFSVPLLVVVDVAADSLKADSELLLKKVSYEF